MGKLGISVLIGMGMGIISSGIHYAFYGIMPVTQKPNEIRYATRTAINHSLMDTHIISFTNQAHTEAIYGMRSLLGIVNDNVDVIAAEGMPGQVFLRLFNEVKYRFSSTDFALGIARNLGPANGDNSEIKLFINYSAIAPFNGTSVAQAMATATGYQVYGTRGIPTYDIFNDWVKFNP